MTLEKWALPQLSRILPLDEDSLRQIIQYTEKLSAEAAALHLKELVGDSPQALEFIASFNSRRRPTSGVHSNKSNKDASVVTKPRPRKENVVNINKVPLVRHSESYNDSSGSYLKKEQKDYVPARHGTAATDSVGSINNDVPNNKPVVSQNQSKATSVHPKLPPSASGPLISDVAPSPSQSSLSPLPSSTSKSKVKVNISGGTPMHGKSTVLNDLDSAIRSLEIQTNPTLAAGKHTGKAGKHQQQQQGAKDREIEKAQRSCNCMATQHPLLTAAPNCLNCGKIICVSEGLGTCTFCDQPLLSSNDLHSMLRILREERGRERTNVHNASYKRADVAASTTATRKSGARALHSTPLSSAPSSDAESFDVRSNHVNGKFNGSSNEDSNKLDAARDHRDKLLAFQAQNSQRTRVHDEAADYDTPVAGLSMWASPQERALQLKQQQKVLRQQEWNARPEYEKRKMVVSVDLVGGKVVKRMAEVERPTSPPKDEAEENDSYLPDGSSKSEGEGGGGAFSRNPLLGSLIKPVINSKGKLAPREKDSAARRTTWRRVQDDDDNEQLILNGSLYGGEKIDRTYGMEEAVY